MLKYVSTVVAMNASDVLLCFNSACPLFGDNICVILLWVKLNKDLEFAPFFVEAAFRSGNSACYHSQLAGSLASQIIIGLHFVAS